MKIMLSAVLLFGLRGGSKCTGEMLKHYTSARHANTSDTKVACCILQNKIKNFQDIENQEYFNACKFANGLYIRIVTAKNMIKVVKVIKAKLVLVWRLPECCQCKPHKNIENPMIDQGSDFRKANIQ